MYLQLAEGNCDLSDQCGLPPLKPLRSREKVPQKWAEYDRKKAAWDACRLGKGKSTINPIKVAFLAPGRALFLAMVDNNVDGLASRLATESAETLRAQWTKIGGDPSKLITFVNNGKRKPKRSIGFLNKFAGPSPLAEDETTDENPYGLSNEQKAKIIAASTAAGTTISALLPPLAPVALPGGPILGSVIVAVLPIIKNAANKTQSAEDAGTKVPDLPIPPSTTVTLPGGTTVTTPTLPGTPPPPPPMVKWVDEKNWTGMSNKTTIVVATNVLSVAGSAILYKKKKKKAAAILLGSTVVADLAYYFITKPNQ